MTTLQRRGPVLSPEERPGSIGPTYGIGRDFESQSKGNRCTVDRLTTRQYETVCPLFVNRTRALRPCDLRSAKSGTREAFVGSAPGNQLRLAGFYLGAICPSTRKKIFREALNHAGRNMPAIRAKKRSHSASLWQAVKRTYMKVGSERMSRRSRGRQRTNVLGT
jgi:hypothetical protein